MSVYRLSEEMDKIGIDTIMERNIRKQDTLAYPAEKASQGEIILRRPWQRAVFLAGLGAAVLLPLIMLFVAR